MFKLLFGEDWTISSSGNVLSSVCIYNNTTYFPHKEWTDFPIAILELWNNEMFKNFKKQREFFLYFLDGEYCLRVTKRKNSEGLNLVVECIDGYPDRINNVIEHYSISATVWFDEIERNLKLCIRFANHNKMDCKKLQHILHRIRRIKNYLYTRNLRMNAPKNLLHR